MKSKYDKQKEKARWYYRNVIRKNQKLIREHLEFYRGKSCQLVSATKIIITEIKRMKHEELITTAQAKFLKRAYIQACFDELDYYRNKHNITGNSVYDFDFTETEYLYKEYTFQIFMVDPRYRV